MNRSIFFIILILSLIIGCDTTNSDRNVKAKIDSSKGQKDLTIEPLETDNDTLPKTVLEAPPPPPPLPPPQSEKIEAIFNIVNPKLEFPGCEEHLGLVKERSCCHQKYVGYIRTNLQYPIKALSDCIMPLK